MMILKNIIIINAFFIVDHVYSIESSNNVNISNYTVNMYLYKKLDDSIEHFKFINVRLEKYNSTGIEVPANQLIIIYIQSDKNFDIKGVIITFDKIGILPNNIWIQWNIGTRKLVCNEEHRIKRL